MSEKDHWLSTVQPLGSARVEFAYERTFSHEEAEKLRAGFWPQSMDERWIVFLGESSLDVWRSWSGYCIYSLAARQAGDGVVVGPMLVNADTEQYCPSSDVDEIQLFQSLIDSVLNVWH